MKTLRSLLTHTIRSTGHPAVQGVTVALLLLIVSAFFCYSLYTMARHEEMQETANIAGSVRNQLEIALIHGLSASQALSLCVEQDVLPASFDSVAPRIFTAHSPIDAVELAPDGIVRFVYPHEENKRALGFNILTDPGQRAEALLAIERRTLIFAGPLNLVQGGSAVVGRRPVFRQRDGKESFWGFAITIIRIPTLLQEARLEELERQGYVFRLSRKLPGSEAESVFYNEDKVLSSPVIEHVRVPHGQWTLAVAPAGGWHAGIRTIPIMVLSIVLSLLSGLFVWYIGRQPGLLRKLVEKRTAELKESENRFRTLIEDAPVAIAINREGRGIYANPQLLQLLALPDEDDYVSHPVTEFMAPESPEKAIERKGRTSRTARVPTLSELVLRRRDGTQVPAQISTATVELSDGPATVAFITDITERKKAEEQMRHSLKEKEILLKEIHHRVKNNLQVISSLLNMQAKLVSDPQARETYADSIRRVRSMSMAHEKLYRSEDLSKVDFGEYLRSVAGELNSSIGRESITLSVSAEKIILGIDTAVPCGLIANELISNALKHAFAGREEGKISVTFSRRSPGQLELSVHDDGRGFPAGVDFRTVPSLGMNIVSSLADQLGGTLSLERKDGTQFTLTFPG